MGPFFTPCTGDFGHFLIEIEICTNVIFIKVDIETNGQKLNCKQTKIFV